ncbi:MAG: YihY/virulence factor BrkB family protein, partial [Candidatus Sumerlaeia bacterium]|nr:YihY/virulence factor BrkB family protein [Candidatus Sumerlaeia bacterium]
MEKLKKWLKIKEYNPDDIWRVRLIQLPAWKAKIVATVRVLLRAGRDFLDDRCSLRASALTFFTLMSVVPVLALSFGVAKGFGFERRLETQLRNAFQGQEEVIERSILFANQLLAQTQGGLVAGIGLIILIWTVVKVLGHIEESFNAIWGISKSRHLLRKFSDYLSFLFVSPMIILISSSMTVFITSQVNEILANLEWLGFMGPIVFSLLRLIPFLMTWFLFTFTYMFIPNTKVNFQSALIAGILAGTAYQITQIAYVNFQIGVTKANAIYGSFAALPLFLTWLQVSWMIMLFGAEIANAHQNLELYEWGEDCKMASERTRRLVMLEIVRQCAVAHYKGERPPTMLELRERLDAPPRFIRQCMERLLSTRILVESIWDQELTKRRAV